MSARDTYHEAIKNALIKDGWMIIRDPYTIKYEEIQLFADLLADRTLEIERNGQQIIVEVKSFISRSPMRELETALGQYIIYRTLLKVILPEAKIYLGAEVLNVKKSVIKIAQNILKFEQAISKY
ncbi:XisH family protein [Sphaerospermopsis aphanizomenoides]|uniref:XisH family protein n=1 Tax=Sphaerospermopsis aphanizomenoides TaxID=459663 RepID=UPI001D15399F|nr:XisH family protein [Sphaerospermopsis aphanizomenoides]